MKRGFSLLELVVTLAVLSTLSLSAVLMLNPQLTYFRSRSAAQRLVAVLRDQQAQAARAGYSDGGGHGGGVVFFRGRAVRDRAAGKYVVEQEDAADVFSFMACPVDHAADPANPSVKMPGATTLSKLTDEELAAVVALPDVTLFRDRDRKTPFESGDHVLFLEKPMPVKEGSGVRQGDRGAAFFSKGLQQERQIVVCGPDADPVYTIRIDIGGLVLASAD